MYTHVNIRLQQNYTRISQNSLDPCQQTTRGQNNLAKAASSHVSVLQNGQNFPPLRLSLAVEDHDSHNAICPGSPKISTPNRTAIHSAVIAQHSRVTDRLTDTPRYGIICRNSLPHAFDEACKIQYTVSVSSANRKYGKKSIISVAGISAHLSL